MQTIKVTGQLFNTNGCALTLILMRDGNVVDVSKRYSSFEDSHVLESGTYLLLVQGATSGSIRITVSGNVVTVRPSPTQDFQQEIWGRFIISL